MADPADKPGVVDSASDTVVLAFELADQEIAKSPERILDALQSADVQVAIKKAMEDFAKNKISKTPTTITEADAKELGKKILEAGGGAVVDHLTHEIKNTAKYVALDQSLKQLTEAIKKTPMGVWVDEHSTLLYIIGPAEFRGARPPCMCCAWGTSSPPRPPRWRTANRSLLKFSATSNWT